jgi:hypothetical protein
VPASTTEAKTPASRGPTKLQVADALEKARARIHTEFETSSFAEIAELISKLMTKYTKEELKL